jgi:hypothetical protein
VVNPSGFMCRPLCERMRRALILVANSFSWEPAH